MPNDNEKVVNDIKDEKDEEKDDEKDEEKDKKDNFRRELEMIKIDIKNIKREQILEEKDVIIIKQLTNIENELNERIGFKWWKSYVAAAFWSNIASPLNLILSIITLLTSGQSTTKNLLSETVNTSISLTAVIISLFNTFFAPHNKMNDNIKLMNEYRNYGKLFEEIYNSPNSTIAEKELRLSSYRDLSKKINDFITDTPEHQNFLTDLLHTIVICFTGNKKWKE